MEPSQPESIFKLKKLSFYLGIIQLLIFLSLLMIQFYLPYYLCLIFFISGWLYIFIISIISWITNIWCQCIRTSINCTFPFSTVIIVSHLISKLFFVVINKKLHLFLPLWNYYLNKMQWNKVMQPFLMRVYLNKQTNTITNNCHLEWIHWK